MSYNMSADFDYYVKHQSELVDKYDGKYIVIVNQKVVGDFDTMDEAVDDARKKYQPGEFFVHLVGEGKDNYTTTITRVRIHA